MKYNYKLLWILPLMFLLLVSMVSATITWATDNDQFIPFANYSESTGLVDLSVTGTDASVTGASLFSDGTSFDYDGVNDWGTTNTNVIEDATDITIDLWFKADTASFGVVGVGGGDRILTIGNTYFAWYFKTGSKLGFFSYDGTSEDFASNSTISTGTWYHVTQTFDGSEQRIYIDGVLDSVHTTANWVDGSDGNNLRLGSSSTGVQWFDGQISDFKTFNRALTSTEIAQIDTDGRNNNPYYSPPAANSITFTAPSNNTYIYGSPYVVTITTAFNGTCKYSTNSAFNFSTEGTTLTGTSLSHTFDIDTTVIDPTQYNLYYKCNQSNGTITTSGKHTFVTKDLNWNNTVLAIGDSVAKADSYVTATQAWHYLLAGNLSVYNVIYNNIINDNQGIGSSCLTDFGSCSSANPLVNRYDADLIARNPRIAVLVPNINDKAYSVPASEYETDLVTILSNTLTKALNTTLLMSTLTTATNGGQDYISAYNAVIREQAVVNEIPFYEIQRFINYNSSLMHDHVHWNVLGNSLISDGFEDIYLNQEDYTMTRDNFDIYHNCNNSITILNHTLYAESADCIQADTTDWIILENITSTVVYDNTFEIVQADVPFLMNITKVFTPNTTYVVNQAGNETEYNSTATGDLNNVLFTADVGSVTIEEVTDNFVVTATNEWTDTSINNFSVLTTHIVTNNKTYSFQSGENISIEPVFDNSLPSYLVYTSPFYKIIYKNITRSIDTSCSPNSQGTFPGGNIVIKRDGLGQLSCVGFNNILYPVTPTTSYTYGEEFRFVAQGILNKSTSTGNMQIPIVGTELVNITFFNDNYFNRTYNDWNLSLPLEGVLYQSEINFTTSEWLTNNTLTGVTYVINGQTNTTFHLSAGEHTVTASKSGYHDLEYTFNVTALQIETINLTGMYDSILNVTTTSYSTGNPINSFNVSTNGVDYTTTSGFIEIPTLQDRINYLNITSNGYSSRLNQNFTTTASLNTTDYLMYPYNSVRILIRDYDTEALITQATTINTIGTLTSFTNTTTTGNITLTLLNPDDYELRFNSSSYTQTSYFINVSDDSTQEITVYMTLNTSNTDIQRTKVIDGSNNPVGGATVWLQKETSGTFNTINQRVSGSDGISSFYVNKDIDEYYRFIVIYDGEVKLITEQTVFVPSIDEIIELVIDITELNDNPVLEDLAGLNTTVWFTGTNDEIVNYQFIDARNKINGARLVITMIDLTDGLHPHETIIKYNTTKSGVSGNYLVPLDMLNDSIYTIKAYVTYSSGVEELVWEGKKQFTITVIADRNTGLLYAIMIFLFAAFLTSKELNPLFSGIISLGILIPLTYLKVISVPIGVVTGFITLFIIVFIKIRGGGNQ